MSPYSIRRQTFFVNSAHTLSKKSSWTPLKVQLFQKCFIFGQLKAYRPIGSSWMSSSFWYQTCKIWLINNRVLTIWMETGTFWKVANVTIHQPTDLLIYHLLCTVEWLHLQLLKTYLSPFTMIRTLSFINRFLQVWYQNGEDIHLLSIICF